MLLPDRCRHDPAVSSPEYYLTPAPNADVIGEPLLVGRHLIILNNSGETLSDGDIAFLNRVREDNQRNTQLVKRNPKYQGLVTGFMELYTEIITKGLENEKTQ